MNNECRHETREEKTGSQATHATTNEETIAQTDLAEARPASESRYGWYVETDEPDPADGIYVGDCVSVNSEGALFIWGPCHQVHYTFQPGTWRFMFPRFLIKKILDGRLHETVVLEPGETEPQHPSKTLAFYCQCCNERV